MIRVNIALAVAIITLSACAQDPATPPTATDYAEAITSTSESLQEIAGGASTNDTSGHYCIDDRNGWGDVVGWHCCSFEQTGGNSYRCCSGVLDNNPWSECSVTVLPHTDPGHGGTSEPVAAPPTGDTSSTNPVDTSCTYPFAHELPAPRDGVGELDPSDPRVAGAVDMLLALNPKATTDMTCRLMRCGYCCVEGSTNCCCDGSTPGRCGCGAP